MLATPGVVINTRGSENLEDDVASIDNAVQLSTQGSANVVDDMASTNVQYTMLAPSCDAVCLA
jgi:hypothetical protein